MDKVILSSEISGSIWKIHCKVGDVIETGQEVLIIESMKMEIPVTSNVSGTVISIFVDEGEMVNEDQKLIELDKKD
ncbi:acetyl-CoA carboxylase biotin carboxyl carrier protein subunit [Paracoccaceae bacterium]|nr:acetyl-CoA carboxylase biotin carboxyl carrier protein subunit [Paracoccaceae bacterium]